MLVPTFFKVSVKMSTESFFYWVELGIVEKNGRVLSLFFTLSKEFVRAVYNAGQHFVSERLPFSMVFRLSQGLEHVRHHLLDGVIVVFLAEEVDHGALFPHLDARGCLAVAAALNYWESAKIMRGGVHGAGVRGKGFVILINLLQPSHQSLRSAFKIRVRCVRIENYVYTVYNSFRVLKRKY
jgi:hypothetical protein